MNVLPEDVQQEVRDRKSTLVSTQAVVDYLNGELARYQDTHLSKIHDRFENKILQQGDKNPVHAIYDTKDLLEDKLKHLEARLEAVQAVTQGRKGSKGDGKGDKGGGKGKGDRTGGSVLDRPDPTWPGGCWHCGKKHAGGRRQCHAFRALIKKHGGLPANCQGAYEIWANQNKQGKELVNALAEDQADILECVACVNVQDPAAQKDAAPPAPAPASGPSPQCATCPHHAAEHEETVQHRFFALLDYESSFADMNKFQELASNDSDYSDLIDAVNQISSNVSVGPKPSQKARKGTRLSPQRIAAIAKDVKSLRQCTGREATWPRLHPLGQPVPFCNGHRGHGGSRRAVSLCRGHHEPFTLCLHELVDFVNLFIFHEDICT